MTRLTHTLRITVFGTRYELELPGPPWLCALVLVGWVSLVTFSWSETPDVAAATVHRSSPAPGAPGGPRPSGVVWEDVPEGGGGGADWGEWHRCSVAADVTKAFEIGISSDLLYLATREEEMLFEHWKSLARLEGSGGIRLFRTGEERYDGARTYLVSFDGVRVVGTMLLRWIDDRWQIVGCSSRAQETLDDARSGKIFDSVRLRLEEEEP